MNLRFLDPAEEEMLEAARLYEDHTVGLGERFLDEVEGCVALLLERPHIGRRVGQFRRFPLRKFPFTLIYALEDDDLGHNVTSGCLLVSSTALQGYNEMYRVCIGSYRLVYEIDDRTVRILVTKIRRRSEVYR